MDNSRQAITAEHRRTRSEFPCPSKKNRPGWPPPNAVTAGVLMADEVLIRHTLFLFLLLPGLPDRPNEPARPNRSILPFPRQTRTGPFFCGRPAGTLRSERFPPPFSPAPAPPRPRGVKQTRPASAPCDMPAALTRGSIPPDASCPAAGPDSAPWVWSQCPANGGAGVFFRFAACALPNVPPFCHAPGGARK